MPVNISAGSAEFCASLWAMPYCWVLVAVADSH